MDGARPTAWVARGRRAEWLLAAFCGLCLIGMVVADPAHAPIPFHFVYTAVTIVYGLRLWRLRGALAAALAVAASTGGITLYNVVTADEPAAELTEVPLMTLMFVATVYHVQSRQRAAAALAAVAEERRQMIERERTFFANVTHDLMTPLTVARGHVDILGRAAAPSPAELAEAKEVVIEELGRIEAMVGDLLLVARLEDHGELPLEPIDAADFLHTVADRWRAVGDRRWTVDIAVQGRIRADPNTLSQALDNVIENAVSYTDPGDAIAVRARAVADSLVVSVSDTGPGIPASALPHVFDRFYRADRARSRVTGGTGLGLAIVRDVVHAHGGSVGAESPPEGGARITITLPGLHRA